jgi:hypothetical protein
MNLRIRELAEQAAEYAAENAAGDWEVGPDYRDVFNKKFAELIVRECANRASWAQDTNEADIGGAVLKHFGVEE